MPSNPSVFQKKTKQILSTQQGKLESLYTGQWPMGTKPESGRRCLSWEEGIAEACIYLRYALEDRGLHQYLEGHHDLFGYK